MLEVFVKRKHNQSEVSQKTLAEKTMGGLTGMEKFSHLEDKIYLTIEFAKKMREEKDRLFVFQNAVEHFGAFSTA